MQLVENHHLLMRVEQGLDSLHETRAVRVGEHRRYVCPHDLEYKGEPLLEVGSTETVKILLRDTSWTVGQDGTKLGVIRN